MLNPHLARLALAVLLIGAFPMPVSAYVGPGSGLSAIGAILAIVAGLFFAVFGFVWYPVKRLLRGSNKTTGESDVALGESGGHHE